MNNNKTISIFCDFDATVSVLDVGDELFKTFGNWNEHYQDFLEEKYDVKELNRRLCKSLKPELTFEEISEFAVKQEIDAYFAKFIAFCEGNNLNFTIVSDGFDAYINPILQHHRLAHLPKYCNSLVKQSNVFEPKFYNVVIDCQCFTQCLTASCKRNVVLNNSSDDDIVVYIGDGHTDFCASEHSDIIFAKSKLAAHCNKNHIPHHYFKTFFDIYRILDNKIKSNELHHRHQAKMKRKSAFEIE